MAFDSDKLVEFCQTAIRRFAEDHRDEVFYAFAIDANLLCLNSEEAFARSLKKYQDHWERTTRPIATWDDLTEFDLLESDSLLESYAEDEDYRLDRSDKAACLAVINEWRAYERKRENPYRNAKKIEALRADTGDWDYQGFAELSESDGFDAKAYEEHYGMSDLNQTTSAYGLAMDEVVERLRKAAVFSCLKTAANFCATRVEHSY